MKKIFLLFVVCLVCSYKGIAQTPLITIEVILDGQIKITNTSSNYSYWDMEYGPTGFTPGTGTLVSNINYSSITIETNTFISYDIRTRNKIFNYTYPWSSMYTFNNCESLYPTGYTTQFETSPTEDCWRGYSSPVNSNAVLIKYEPTTKYVRMEVTNVNGVAFLVAPKLEGMLANKKISFTTYGYNTSGLSVGTLSDPYDPSTFHLIQTIIPGTVYAQHFNVNLTGYNGTDQYIAFRKEYGGPGPANASIFIDNFVYQQACTDVTNFNITEIGEQTAQLNFESPSQAQWEASIYNTATNQTQIVPVNSTPFTLQGLLGNTNYQIKIRSLCGSANFSAWSATLNLTTLCEDMEAGYSTSFDLPLLDPCWHKITTGAANVSTVTDDPSVNNIIVPRTGARMISMRNWSYNNHSFLISRYTSNLDNLKQISFYLIANEGSSYNVSPLVIGTMANPNDAATFIPLETIAPSQMSEQTDNLVHYDKWKKHTISLSDYNIANDHHYIVLKHGSLGSNSTFYIDDFLFENIPACAEPINLNVVDTEHDTATITWENGEDSTSSEWQIEYGPEDFLLGTGTLVTVTSNTTTLTDIAMDDTEHDFYVRAKCGNDYSRWSYKWKFSTRCAGVTSGYTIDFEDDSINTLNSCWTANTPTRTSGVIMRPRDFITTISSTGPNAAHSGTKAIKFRQILQIGQTGASQKTILVTPRLNDLSTTSIFSFWLKSEATPNGSPSEIIVGTLSDANDYTTFTPFYTITDAPLYEGQWKQYTINFSGYNGTDKFIGIRQGQINIDQTIYLDDFAYSTVSCPTPTELLGYQSGNTSATLQWDSNTDSTPDSWEVELDGIIITTTQNPLIIEDLIPGSPHSFRVRNMCQGGTGSWSSLSYFRVTDCVGIAPLYENFDQYDVFEQEGFCWTFNVGGGQMVPFCLDGYTSCPNAIELTSNYEGTTGNDMIVSPFLTDFDQDKKVRFFAYTQYFDANVVVGTMTNPFNPSTFVPFTTVYLNPEALYGQEYEVDFAGYTGVGKHIALRHDGVSDTAYLYLDNIRYLSTNGCGDPINSQAINITANSAVISWEAVPGVENFVIEYGPAGFEPGSGTTIAATGSQQIINGLSGQSAYEFYIKSSCGDNVYGVNIGPGYFMTICNDTPLPWFETFNDLPQYGDNKPAECFRLIMGVFTSFNTPVPGMSLNGADDTFYLYTSSFDNKLITPVFHLIAGTTYTFSYDGRKGSNWSSISNKVFVGQGHTENVMFTQLSRVGELTSQFNTLKYHFTPLNSGDYSFMLNLSGANSGGLTLDKFKLDEGYNFEINTAVVDLSFENGIPAEIIAEETENTNIATVLDGENYALIMEGGLYDDEWVSVANPDGRNSNSNNELWVANENFITKANFKIDATAMESLYLSFKLRQTYNDNASESRFRIVINGEVIQEILPQTPLNDPYIPYLLNLDEYLGTQIRISLQHLGKLDVVGTIVGDNAFLTDLEFTGEDLSTLKNVFNSFSLYPNPVTDIITLGHPTEITGVEIYNVSGQLLHSSKHNSSEVRLDISNYSPGFYLVNISSGSAKKTYKVMKN